MDLFSSWRPEDLTTGLRAAINTEKTKLHFGSPGWIQLRAPYRLGWQKAGDAPLTLGQEYRLVQGTKLPESLHPWVTQETWSMTPADRLWAGELVDVTEISDAEFDELERVWEACSPEKRKYGHTEQGLILENTSSLRRMRAHCFSCHQPWIAKIPPSAKTETETETETATETKNQKETKMTPITIERPILINSLRIQSYDSAARSRLIQEQEAQIKAIEALEFKTQETKDEIAAARENLVEVIRLFDEDYAARKETAKD